MAKKAGPSLDLEMEVLTCLLGRRLVASQSKWQERAHTAISSCLFPATCSPDHQHLDLHLHLRTPA